LKNKKEHSIFFKYIEESLLDSAIIKKESTSKEKRLIEMTTIQEQQA